MKKSIVAAYVAMSLILLIMGIDITSVYLILDALQNNLHLSAGILPWIAMLYMMFFLGSIVIGGRLGDRYGYKVIVLVGIVLFTLASTMIALADSIIPILLGRAIQGLAAAMIWPNTMTLWFQAIPKRFKAHGIGCFTGVIGLSLAIGPLLGGALTHYLSWRWVFGINLPIGVLSVLLLLVYKPISQLVNTEKLDWFGSIILVFAMMVLAFGLGQLPHNAAFHHWAWGALLAAIVLLYGFYRQQKISQYPILPKKLVSNTGFRLGCLQRFLLVMPFYICLYSVSLLVQQKLHGSAATAGMVFLPMMLLIGLLSPLGGWVISRYGAGHTLRLAGLSYMTAFLLLYGFGAYLNFSYLSLVLVFIGIGYAAASPSSIALALQSVDSIMQGAASGIFYMVSLCSGLIGVSCASVLYEGFQDYRVIFIFCLVISLMSLFVQIIRKTVSLKVCVFK